ncbi:MAG: hypothetical protein ACK6DF_02475 [Betaproteobacteria bacterium]
MSARAGRCALALTRQDLGRLAGLVRRSREDFFRLSPAWGLVYARRLLAVALAGDAAEHFMSGTRGFEGFEVWQFFAAHPEAPFPPHKKFREDYGRSRFGRDPSLPESFAGRAVDWQGRSLEAAPAADAVATLQGWLRARPTPTARSLAAGTLVLLEPEPLLGYCPWPTLLV